MPWWLWGGLSVALVAVMVLVVARAANSGQSSDAPLLAPVNASATGATVDGIQCGSHEELLFHIHAHVAIMVNGSPRAIPAGVGIVSDGSGGGCIYWLHTHTADGVIHMEAPVHRSFVLGDFFDIWGQPLSATQVGPAHGAVIAYVDGKRFNGDPRSIPLTAHALVQLDVGGDAAPQPFGFPEGL